VVLIDFSAYFPDSRANRLEDYLVRAVKNSTRERLYLRGPAEAATQVTWSLERLERNPRRLPLRKEDGSEWTDRLEFDGPLPEAVADTLSVLQSALTLVKRKPLHVAMALDFHTVPIDGVDPQQWPRTEVGSLVYRAKYRGNREALASLSDRLADIAARHELYQATDLVLTVPGHDVSRQSFGERLAYDVAKRIGVPMIKTGCSQELRPEAKSGLETAELESLFSVDRSVRDGVVLIVDDVYRSGSTMSAVAHAAERAGARGRLGLVGARTLKK
jgi:adenine/guanine phosphoribosyltransferase-like PRPP-binding protein